MAKYDVTKLNVAIDKLLETTTNPRHRFLLQAYTIGLVRGETFRSMGHGRATRCRNLHLKDR
jgi:hypothetical protein